MREVESGDGWKGKRNSVTTSKVKGYRKILWTKEFRYQKELWYFTEIPAGIGKAEIWAKDSVNLLVVWRTNLRAIWVMRKVEVIIWPTNWASHEIGSSSYWKGEANYST